MCTAQEVQRWHGAGPHVPADLASWFESLCKRDELGDTKWHRTRLQFVLLLLGRLGGL